MPPVAPDPDSPAPDPRARFSATVDDYARWRPSYPDALLDWIAASVPLSPDARIADLGCGTGIFSRRLAGRSYRVTGIDPNPDMLARARAAGGGIEYRAGEAAATGLETASFDLVAGAQSFHWFDLALVLPEIARILAPQGAAVAIWNCRESTPFLDEYEGLLREHSSDYARIETPEATLAAIRARPEVRDPREASFANAQRFDREGLLGRARSSSYVVHGVPDLAAFDRALLAAFARHQVGGEVEFAYRTAALLWRLPPAA